ncbi:YveK family protein [Lactiplantibacillus pentosus]|uniref:YveK family protein n=1 Tax=Lactiplantibacillus pentosus TaxID=1589 RepID=UPI00218211A8|nr:Wzz/FepE/Etk N-terminal domain-containing protein [Lactiplantibacillus pentosus]MCT0162166.1 hypothetical protein [Lactiplantibacillus pentosus]
MKKLSFSNVLSIVWKNVFVIIIFVGLFGVGGYFGAKKFIVPSYSATRQIVIHHGSLKKYTSLSSDMSMMQTYATAIKDPKIVNAVNTNLKGETDHHYSSSELLDKVYATPVNNSITMTIGVTDVSTASDAAKIVNELGKVTKANLNSLTGAGEVKLLGKAQVSNADESSPSVLQVTEISLILGLLVGLIVAAVRGVHVHKRH